MFETSNDVYGAHTGEVLAFECTLHLGLEPSREQSSMPKWCSNVRRRRRIAKSLFVWSRRELLCSPVNYYDLHPT